MHVDDVTKRDFAIVSLHKELVVHFSSIVDINAAACGSKFLLYCVVLKLSYKYI